jgi:hypothetical protein
MVETAAAQAPAPSAFAAFARMASLKLSFSAEPLNPAAFVASGAAAAGAPAEAGRAGGAESPAPSGSDESDEFDHAAEEADLADGLHPARLRGGGASRATAAGAAYARTLSTALSTAASGQLTGVGVGAWAFPLAAPCPVRSDAPSRPAAPAALAGHHLRGLPARHPAAPRFAPRACRRPPRPPRAHSPPSLRPRRVLARAGTSGPQGKALPFTIIDDPAAWTAKDWAGGVDSIVYTIDAADAAAIRAAADDHVARGAPLAGLRSAADFPLPEATAARLAAAKAELLTGRGVAVLRGLPLDEMECEREILAAYLGVCAHVGQPGPQWKCGRIVTHVTSKGKTVDANLAASKHGPEAFNRADAFEMWAARRRARRSAPRRPQPVAGAQRPAGRACLRAGPGGVGRREARPFAPRPPPLSPPLPSPPSPPRLPRPPRRHNDSCADVLGLLCIRQAAEGGESAFASALSVYNEMLRRGRLDLVAVLAGAGAPAPRRAAAAGARSVRGREAGPVHLRGWRRGIRSAPELTARPPRTLPKPRQNPGSSPQGFTATRAASTPRSCPAPRPSGARAPAHASRGLRPGPSACACASAQPEQGALRHAGHSPCAPPTHEPTQPSTSPACVNRAKTHYYPGRCPCLRGLEGT